MKKKLFSIIMCVLMVMCFMPTAAFAVEGVGEGDNSDASTPADNSPMISGDTITVDTTNIQDVLDGKYGSIDNKTIVLTTGNYAKLEIGRATKYEGSNTEYRLTSFDNEKMDITSFLTAGAPWDTKPCYTRTLNNITFKPAEGATVTVAGIKMTAGKQTIDQGDDIYDYVLNKEIVSGVAYDVSLKAQNIKFENITFTAKCDIEAHVAIYEGNGKSSFENFTFDNCTFNINNAGSGNVVQSRPYQAINYNNADNRHTFTGLVVKNCTFNTCYQGVYTHHVRGITVDNCEFNVTGHNAIAIQADGNFTYNHGEVVIENNTFTGIKDRIIRFNNVGADTQITIKSNTATNSGDSNKQVIKATSLADGITYDICDNNWGEEAVIANETLKDSDAVAEISTVKYTTLSKAIAAASNGQTIKLLEDISDEVTVPAEENITIDLNGKTISGNVTNNGALIIADSNGAGKVTSTLTNGENCTLTITGGTFSSDPTTYLTGRYYALNNGDGTYTVRYRSSSSSSSSSTTKTDNVTNTTETTKTETGTTEAKAETKATVSAETKTAADGTKTTTATVDTTTATKIVEKAVENKSEEVVVTAAATPVAETAAGTTTEVAIPAETVSQIAEKTTAAVTIESEAAKVTLDQEAVAAVAETAGEAGTVSLVVETKAQDENKVEVELKLETSNGAVSDFKGGTVSVTVKLNASLAAKPVMCVYIDDNGVYHKVAGQKNADGTYTFQTGHFSTYAILPEEEADAVIDKQADSAKDDVKALSLKARSTKTAKGSIKVNLTVDDESLKAIEDLGYTVKYKFYRSTNKSSGYKAMLEKAGKTYTNTTGKKGTRYYYKARVMVYDSEGTLIAKSALTQCKYASRIK